MEKLGFGMELEHIGQGEFFTGYHHEIIFVLEGEAGIEADGKRTELGRADFLFLEANTTYVMHKCKTGTLARLRINAELVDDIMGTRFYTIRCCSTGIEKEGLSAVRAILDELLRGFLQNGNRPSFRQTGLFFQLLDELNIHFRETEKTEITAKKFFTGDERLTQIVRYVQENYAAQISLRELAQSFHITESHLSRIIKRGLGIGFCQYVNSVRLEQAIEELRRTNKSITRIANDCGFSSVAKFNKAFKEAVGKTPTECKKEMLASGKVMENTQTKEKVDSGILERYLEEAVPADFGEECRKKIKIDAFLAAPYTKSWESVINIGTAPGLLNVKIQKHILFLKKQLNFSYVRFWGIFQREMMLISEYDGYSALNFDCLDEVLMFLLNNGLKPFILLAPKPQTMMSRPLGKEFRRSENLSLLKCSVDEWKQLVESLMKHFISYFDEQEVETWIFEMWNPAPWDGEWYKWYTEEYYVETIRIIKKYAVNAKIGGCEYTLAAHAPKMEKYIEVWKRSEVMPDFLSWSGFPYEWPQKEASKPLMAPNQLFRTITEIRQNMAECGLGDRKLYITTWNNTISNRNILNDSLWKGAYIIKNVIDVVGLADVLAYWVASDSYTIYHDTKAILFGGSGLVSKDGIAKPAFWAFSFLGRLRKQLVQKGENYIVTRSSHGNYTIVCHNMKPLNVNFYLRKEDELESEDISSCFSDCKELKLALHIYNLMGNVYNMRCQYVDKNYGSILDNWQKLGGFRDIPKEDISYLDRITVPRMQVGRVRPVEGELTLDIDLDANAFCVVELMLVET